MLTDAEVAEWDDALKSGDDARVAEVKERLLRRIHTNIMNEDIAYHEAGWTPTAAAHSAHTP